MTLFMLSMNEVLNINLETLRLQDVTHLEASMPPGFMRLSVFDQDITLHLCTLQIPEMILHIYVYMPKNILMVINI